MYQLSCPDFKSRTFWFDKQYDCAEKPMKTLYILLGCQLVLVGQSSHSEDKAWSLCECFQYARVEGRSQWYLKLFCWVECKVESSPLFAANAKLFLP